MSWQAVKAVLELSEATGARRLALIVLAESAHPDGTNAYPSVTTIARRMRRSRRTAQKALRDLEHAGEIVSCGPSPKGPTRYRILCVQDGVRDPASLSPVEEGGDEDLHGEDAGPCASPGVDTGAKDAQASAPEPSLNPPSEAPRKREWVSRSTSDAESVSSTLEKYREALRADDLAPRWRTRLQRMAEELEDQAAAEVEIDRLEGRVAV